MSKVYDCFMMFNEIEVARLRMEILYPHVTKFVIVESNKTHLGQDKPFYFEQNKELFAKYADKIIHKKLDISKRDNGWDKENYQRYKISEFLKELELNDDDIVMMSDCDEIWRPEALADARSYPYCFFNQMYFLYYINLFSGKCVTGTSCCKYSVLKMLDSNYNNCGLQMLRNSKDYGCVIENAGWHYGYMGGSKTISEKSRAIVEGKVSGPNTTEEYFEKQIKQALETKTSPYSSRPLKLLNINESAAYFHYTTARNGSWIDSENVLDYRPNIDLRQFSHLIKTNV